MQIKNWDNLKVLLAIKRRSTLSAAARSLGVDATTVSRRLSVLQQSIGKPLYSRQSDGSLNLTPLGETISEKAEAMEVQFEKIEELAGQGKSCSGTVRLTAVPILANRLLVPASGSLLERYPELLLELIPESRDLSLSRREADVAVRLARPITGGMATMARKVATLDYAVFTASGVSREKAESLPWITYEDSMAHLPQSRWIYNETAHESDKFCSLRVHDAETALEATIHGLGKTLLPVIVGANESRLTRYHMPVGSALPEREVWLLTHREQRRFSRIEAVVEWLGHIFER